MASRHAIPVVGVFALIAVGVVAGWMLVSEPEPVAVSPTPEPVLSPPASPVAHGVAVAAPSPPVERDDQPADVKNVIALARSSTIDPDPRTAEPVAELVFADFRAARAAVLRELGLAAITDLRNCEPPAGHLKALNAEEAEYRRRLARSADAWRNSHGDLSGNGTRPLGIGAARRRALRDSARSTNPDAAATAIATLDHLRRTFLEDLFHRTVGKDHGSVAELVTDVMLAGTAADRLESIDDGERGAAQVHAEWRAELVARFAKSPKDVTPAEVAAWLSSGCYAEAKAAGPSGTNFAFLDPARNPDLAKAAAGRPFRRLVQEWAANHDKDAGATAAAAELLKGGK